MGMIDVTLSILALVAGGITLELFTVPRVTPGFREDRASRTVAQPVVEEFQAGNPS